MIKVHVRRKPDRASLQLYYVDPLTGQDRTRSAGTDNLREAERAAAAWEVEVNQGRRRTGLSWDAFRLRFEDEHTAGLSRDGRQSYATAMNKFEALIGCPRAIADIDSMVLSQFVAKLRKAGHPSTTVSNYVKHVTSALGWAAKMAMIASAPRVLLPREGARCNGSRHSARADARSHAAGIGGNANALVARATCYSAGNPVRRTWRNAHHEHHPREVSKHVRARRWATWSRSISSCNVGPSNGSRPRRIRSSAGKSPTPANGDRIPRRRWR